MLPAARCTGARQLSHFATTSPRCHMIAAVGGPGASASLNKVVRGTHPALLVTSSSAIPAEEQAKLVETSKRLAAYQAVKDHLLSSYTRIGIGSGSTVVYVVEAIAALGPAATADMIFYPTGAQSEDLIEAAGLRLQYINKLPAAEQLDVAFDGADEVDADLNLIKGGGACLWQEKLVATAAKRFVCVADFRKLSARLGTSWKKGIPIEVLPMAAPRVLAELKAMGSHNPRIRPGLPGKAGAIVTDNGMWIIDAPFTPLLLPRDAEEGGIKAGNGDNGVWQVDALADKLIKIPGVAEIGLFYGNNGLEIASGAQKPVAAYFGMADGSVEVKTPIASA
ncbi:ribose 5-phosphate isomerase A-domain-containing protein [Podospora didyma]|uniref:Ribose-5-phosphate isomerase n=1 Tax=Podospora didyma TaxID=330526 RepID=A0AAE0U3N8_9PEZI|nr:ribose 5-phosphate isomerase A-domain-containing protein [Podospora didyma]